MAQNTNKTNAHRQSNAGQAANAPKKTEKGRGYWAERRKHGHAGKPAPAAPAVIAAPRVVAEETVEATIVSLCRGFAFARPKEGAGDYFIHGDKLAGAFLGDSVLLDRVRKEERGPSAGVKQIIVPASRVITGTLTRTHLICEIVPDVSIRYPLTVEKGFAMGARDGDKVQAELHGGVRTGGVFLARVIKIYGRSQSARICSDAIIDQYNIRTVFAPDVLAEAKATEKRGITERELEGRLDLRETSICTIDSASAKDLDDAISVSRTKTGFRLGVHIADVSHYVREGGAMDLEAMERGTSVYFADRVIPMLPEAISNGVCSLNAGVDKLTFSAIVDVDGDGNIVKYSFKKSVINSKVRGVYSEVNALFDGSAGKELKQKYAPVARSLNAARELADILRAKSKRDGTVDLESSESSFTINEDGLCVDVHPRCSGASEQMIEQLMIAANQAAAKLAREKAIPFVYRVHERPSPDRVENLAALVGALGLNAAGLVHPDKVTNKDLAGIMEQAADTPAQKVVGHQLLRTMAKARYDTQPIGHFGLALADYCHFTSPIRRYPDTSIHRILTALLEKQTKEQLVKRYGGFAQLSAEGSSQKEVSAMQAERGAEDCYMAEYMSQHLGEHAVGVISGVTMRGVFVQLPNSVEGFVPVQSFPGARFKFDGVVTQYDEGTGQKLTIGQSLPVLIVAADVAAGRVDLAFDVDA